MIDTHSHIYGPEYDDDRNEVVSRAKEAGVQKLLLANVDSSTVAQMLQCNAKYPNFTAMAMGLHPTSVDDNYKSELSIIEGELNKRNYAAIGEIGLDLYWDKTYQIEQEEVLKAQLDWSLQMNLPVILHIRKAYAEVFKVLNQFKGKEIRGVFHCFGGGVEEAKKALQMGFYLGIGGVLTYKNSNLGDIIKEVGIDRIVLETDAPYLSPVPLRGKRNEPKNLVYVRDKLASLFQEKIENVEKITTQNALNLFNNL